MTTTPESGPIGTRWGTDALCHLNHNCRLGRDHDGPCRGTYGDIIAETSHETYVGKHRSPKTADTES